MGMLAYMYYVIQSCIYKLIIILNLVMIWGNQFNYNKLINTNSYFKKFTFNI